jgi:hypothetical protein
MPFLCPGPPDQDGGIKRWAEPGSLEDSCPSNAQARLTKMEVQKRWVEPGSLEDSCPSDALTRRTKMALLYSPYPRKSMSTYNRCRAWAMSYPVS